MEKNMTLEQFVKDHPNDSIQIMSPGGYVSIDPDKPKSELFAHAGFPGSEIPISWDELKNQIITENNFNEVDNRWYMITDRPSMQNELMEEEIQDEWEYEM